LIAIFFYFFIINTGTKEFLSEFSKLIFNSIGIE